MGFAISAPIPPLCRVRCGWRPIFLTLTGRFMASRSPRCSSADFAQKKTFGSAAELVAQMKRDLQQAQQQYFHYRIGRRTHCIRHRHHQHHARQRRAGGDDCTAVLQRQRAGQSIAARYRPVDCRRGRCLRQPERHAVGGERHADRRSGQQRRQRWRVRHE